MKWICAAVMSASLFGSAQAATFDEARQLMGQGRTAEAVPILRAVTAAEPDNAVAWNTLGSALNQTEQYAEALIAAERAVALDPGHFAYRFNRALVYWEHGRFEEAVRDFDLALAKRPGFAPALTERGTSLAALGRMAEARASWAEAEKADPAYIWTRFYRGVGAVAEGDFANAVDDLDAVAAKESLFSVQLWRWVAHRRAGWPAPRFTPPPEWPGPIGLHLNDQITAEQLIAEARRARLAIDERREASAWFFVGHKHLAEGRLAQARAAFERAVAIGAPNHAERAGAANELKRGGQ